MLFIFRGTWDLIFTYLQTWEKHAWLQICLEESESHWGRVCRVIYTVQKQSHQIHTYMSSLTHRDQFCIVSLSVTLEYLAYLSMWHIFFPLRIITIHCFIGTVHVLTEHFYICPFLDNDDFQSLFFPFYQLAYFCVNRISRLTYGSLHHLPWLLSACLFVCLYITPRTHLLINSLLVVPHRSCSADVPFGWVLSRFTCHF